MNQLPLASEQVILAAPMSFTGITRRVISFLKRHHTGTPWKDAVGVILAVLWLLVMYTVILIWYFIFGLLLVPYRLIRRSQRRDVQRRLQHEELMTALQQRPPQISGNWGP